MLSAIVRHALPVADASATRYGDIVFVVANVSVCLPAPGPAYRTSGGRSRSPYLCVSIVAESAKVAFKAGSSNDGNARRASVASSCVMAYSRLLARLR